MWYKYKQNTPDGISCAYYFVSGEYCERFYYTPTATEHAMAMGSGQQVLELLQKQCEKITQEEYEAAFEDFKKKYAVL